MAHKTSKIRPATKNDLDQCEKLLHMATMRCATGEYYTKAFLKEYLDKDLFLIAENNHKVIGCIFGEMVRGKGAIVWVIAVSEKLRGSGTGSKLLKAFEKHCKNLKIQWIILYAPQNKNKTCEFYEKHQFNKGIASVEFVKELRKTKSCRAI